MKWNKKCFSVAKSFKDQKLLKTNCHVCFVTHHLSK